MLIGHISDTHLGAMPYNKQEREEDFYESFNEAIDIMIKERVDLIIHAGDVFDVPRPSGTALVKLVDALKRLKEKGIKFAFTLGEHDISRIYSIPSPLVYQHADLAIYIGDGKARKILNGLTVVGYHKRRRDEIDELKENLKTIEKELSGIDDKKILVLHQGLYEFHKYAGEMTSNDLPRDFDYYAMGHLHDRFEKKFEDLKGYVCYPGSIDSTTSEGIREFEKGFYIVDLSAEEASHQWVKLSTTRKQFTFAIDYSALDKRIGEIITLIKELRKKPMLNLKIKGGDADRAKIASSLRTLQDYALYYQWDVEEVESSWGRNFTERPADIEQEMLGIAESILGSKEAAILAVNEVLPLLAENRVDEAAEILWRCFEERRRI